METYTTPARQQLFNNALTISRNWQGIGRRATPRELDQAGRQRRRVECARQMFHLLEN
jgi:hypothetical protein